MTILKWARRQGLRKDRAYRAEVQSANARKRRLTPAQKQHQRELATGRTLSLETRAKIVRTKRERGTLPRGAAHPFWKGGRPWERFKDPAYREWRSAVLERDQYTCQACGRKCAKRERGLAAHHIKPYASHPELRLDVGNGLTLCRRCHMAMHGRPIAPARMRACACGCGMQIAAIDAYGRPRRFVKHHAARLRSAGGPRSS